MGGNTCLERWTNLPPCPKCGSPDPESRAGVFPWAGASATVLCKNCNYYAASTGDTLTDARGRVIDRWLNPTELDKV